jgi:lauroyl/myristoyl acyltransferase
MGELAGRALSGGAWDPLWEGTEPPSEPAVYVTAHLGSLLALRYILRARGVAVASVIAPHNFERADPAAKDAVFDRRFPMVFPHVVSSAHTHRLRGLLKRGSLILAADLPMKPANPTAASGAAAFAAPLLGGAAELDSRPFRLARLARVPCVPVFLTLPRRRWTVTLGRPLDGGGKDEDERKVLARFARAFREAAARAPWDLDGPVYWNRYVAARQAS